jgi:preprotein translocase subunit SecF
LLAPLSAIASALMLALLTGVAIGALSTLIVALAMLYLLLREVFGVSIDVNLA